MKRTRNIRKKTCKLFILRAHCHRSNRRRVGGGGDGKQEEEGDRSDYTTPKSHSHQ